MYASNAYNAYKNNSVNYASKEQLLLMLVDGAVKFSKIGRQAILEKDVKKAHENIVKTQDIFIELMATLDINQAGPWGKQLMSVYEFINYNLVQVNLKKDIKKLDELIPVIEEVRDTWHEAYKLSKREV
ncbi:flagellar export chaperone FliS [Desnuesiella massiliensis]|uniref:flagellar export chaperone FliS n=1 Tax=Desnuesiella massiliensis TaxID=1650662 RepID=UPI0006E2F3B6|nr:flagellar export chaperone FliS [Desnuesiella massiliensis]